MSHDHGLFVNDLFNGEALSGGLDADRGIFHRNLFDGEALSDDALPPSKVPVRPNPARIIYNNGLFTRDLFNGGESVSGLGSLGQTASTTPSVTPASDALISQLAVTGGAAATSGGKTAGGTMSTVDKSGGGGAPTAYTPYAAPAAPVDMSSGQSGTNWLPIALIGGAAALTIGVVVMATRKPKSAAATANRRRARRNRRKSRR